MPQADIDNPVRLHKEVKNRIACNSVDKEWQEVINFCKREYDYVFIGAETPYITNQSGKCQVLFFAGPDGKPHCLTTANFTRRTIDKPPLFSW